MLHLADVNPTSFGWKEEIRYLCGRKDGVSAFCCLESEVLTYRMRGAVLCDKCFSHPKAAIRLLGALL